MDGVEQTEKYPPSFRVTLDATPSKKTSLNDQEIISKQFDNTIKKPQCLFKDESEYRHTIDEYGKIIFISFFKFYFNKKIFINN